MVMVSAGLTQFSRICSLSLHFASKSCYYFLLFCFSLSMMGTSVPYCLIYYILYRVLEYFVQLFLLLLYHCIFLTLLDCLLKFMYYFLSPSNSFYAITIPFVIVSPINSSPCFSIFLFLSSVFF